MIALRARTEQQRQVSIRFFPEILLPAIRAKCSQMLVSGGGGNQSLRGHSVFARIVVKGTQPGLLLAYLRGPWNPPACPGLWSLFGH